MSYSVKQTNGNYDIVEKQSETIIELGCDETKARDLCRKLNLGAGFNGWTPAFMSQKYSVK
jgi:hypothetical protein